MKNHAQIKEFLDESHDRFNCPDFIEPDPISIPHRFSKKEDIEIAGFLAATLAWGRRPQILRFAGELIDRMDNDPHSFLMDMSPSDLRSFRTFYYRTFNGVDCTYFLRALRHIYKVQGGMENLFATGPSGIRSGIRAFRELFFSLVHSDRTEKHLSDPDAGSACKRVNMFLRWMVRKDKRGVDFGIWKISPAILMCPLDVHSGNMARQLGLLDRKQNDWQAVEELTSRLRMFDRNDPVKYDFALFGSDLPAVKKQVTSFWQPVS